jgi:hypothetical protein
VGPPHALGLLTRRRRRRQITLRDDAKVEERHVQLNVQGRSARGHDFKALRVAFDLAL